MGDIVSCSCMCGCDNEFDTGIDIEFISPIAFEAEGGDFNEFKAKLTICPQCKNGFHVTRVKIENDDDFN